MLRLTSQDRVVLKLTLFHPFALFISSQHRHECQQPPTEKTYNIIETPSLPSSVTSLQTQHFTPANESFISFGLHSFTSKSCCNIINPQIWSTSLCSNTLIKIVYNSECFPFKTQHNKNDAENLEHLQERLNIPWMQIHQS